MRDGAVRRTIKRLARWRFQADLAVTRWLDARRHGAPYELRGHCNGCGACCVTPTIQVNRWLYHSRVWRRLLLAWHHQVNGFVLVASDRQSHQFVFRCTHYDATTKLCDAYDSRPGMCRDYPRNLLDGGAPEFLPPCSYYASAHNADEFRATLDQLDLSPEKRAEIERRLHLAPPSTPPPAARPARRDGSPPPPK